MNNQKGINPNMAVNASNPSSHVTQSTSWEFSSFSISGFARRVDGLKLGLTELVVAVCLFRECDD